VGSGGLRGLLYGPQILSVVIFELGRKDTMNFDKQCVVHELLRLLPTAAGQGVQLIV